MALVTRYHEGGYDPAKPGGNVAEEYDDGTPEPVDVQARFRDAVSKATTLASLKDALLGTTTGVEPGARPR